MVNPGHSSRGCLNCRFRRIKCDETKPWCINCAKSKRTCLGYDRQNLPNSYSERTIRNKADIDPSNQRVLRLRPRISSPGVRHSQVTDLPRSQEQVRINCATQSVVTLMGMSFGSLTATSCSLEDRRKLLQRYQDATRDLALGLSSVSDIAGSELSSFLFALYEMTVNMDFNDKTWIVHLDGFLAILRTHNSASNNVYFSSLRSALRVVYQGHDAQTDFAVDDNARETKSILMTMDVAKLRLRQLIVDLNKMAQSKASVRTINIQKLRVDLKAVYRDALLMTSTTVVGKSPINIADQNSCRAVVIIAANLLIQTGTSLERKQPFQTTKGCTKLQQSIQEATDAIYASVVHLFLDEDNIADGSNATSGPSPAVIDGILTMWPLHTAAVACDIDEDRRSQMRALLWRIGELARVPKALSLATMPHDKIEKADIVAGLLLVRSDLLMYPRGFPFAQPYLSSVPAD